MIRPERAGDEDAIRAVETAAFGRALEAKIVDDVRGSLRRAGRHGRSR